MIEQGQAPGSFQGSTRISVPWSARDALFGVALVAGGTTLAFVTLSVLPGVGEPEDENLLLPIVLGLLQGLMVVAAWLFGIKKYGARWRALGFVRTQSRSGMLLPWPVLLLSLLFFGLYVSVVEAWGIEPLSPPDIPSGALGDGLYKTLNIAILGVLGPLAEEVFFRGFLLAALMHPLGAWRAVAVCSAIFAVSHGSLGLLIPVFVSGALLSWLYVKTGSIWPSFTAHAAQNLIAVTAISLAG